MVAMRFSLNRSSNCRMFLRVDVRPTGPGLTSEPEPASPASNVHVRHLEACGFKTKYLR